MAVSQLLSIFRGYHVLVTRPVIRFSQSAACIHERYVILCNNFDIKVESGYPNDSVSVSSTGSRAFEPRHTTDVKLVPVNLSIERIVLASTIASKAMNFTMNFTRSDVLREDNTGCKNIY